MLQRLLKLLLHLLLTHSLSLVHLVLRTVPVAAIALAVVPLLGQLVDYRTLRHESQITRARFAASRLLEFVCHRRVSFVEALTSGARHLSILPLGKRARLRHTCLPLPRRRVLTSAKAAILSAVLPAMLLFSTIGCPWFQLIKKGIFIVFGHLL